MHNYGVGGVMWSLTLWCFGPGGMVEGEVLFWGKVGKSKISDEFDSTFQADWRIFLIDLSMRVVKLLNYLQL